jgi:DtxR family transcriptional regulator, iron-dependent repressor
MDTNRPTQTVEDYLQLIYTISRDRGHAMAARLKDRLGVTAPTVWATLRRMERDGLIRREKPHEIELTDAGRAAAESIIRRHMLAERLLTDILKLSWADAHDEAHRMEHAISPLVEQQLLNLLGDPTTCPHGNPIPGVGAPRRRETRHLPEVGQGETVVINNISEDAEEDKELMRFLERNSLVPGANLVVEEVMRPNETITVTVGGGDRVTVGLTAARVIQVLP